MLATAPAETPAAEAAIPAVTDEPSRVLVVAPGETVRLIAPEPEGRMEAALDGGVLRPVGGGVEAPDDGDHWLAVAFRDRAGNSSPVRWVRLRVDGRPPDLELTTEPPWVEVDGRPWVAAGARAVARADDDPAGVATTTLMCGGATVERDGDEATCTLPAGPAAAPAVSVTAGAVDRVGNRAPEIARELALDGLPPRVTVTAVGPTATSEVGLVLGPGARLEVAGEDRGSGLAAWSHRLDGVEVSGYDGLVWGPHRVEAVAVDRVGNRSADEPFHLFWDDRPPRLTAELGASGRAEVDGVLYLRPPVEIRVTAGDVPAGLAALTWAPAAGPWRDLAAVAVASGAGVELTDLDAVGVRTGVRAAVRFDVTNLGSGSDLRLGAVDRVGNRARVTLRGGWRLDDTPPRIAVPRPAVAAGEPLEVAVEDDGSGVAAARWRLDDGPWHDLDGPLRPGSAGEHRLDVTAEDRVGNRATGTWTVRVEGEVEG